MEKAGEKNIEKKLREEVKTLGGIAIKLSSHTFTGLPDRVVLMQGGRVYFVETKSEGKKLSPRQAIVVGMLRGLGFSVDVIDSFFSLNEFLKKIKK